MKYGYTLIDQEETGVVLPRLLVMRVVAAGFFLLLLGALFQTQIFKGNYYRTLADGNRIRELVIHAPRGIIFDRNGVALVANLPAFRLRSCKMETDCEIQTISKDQAISLEATGFSGGQTLEVDSTRSYLYGPAFAHVLGYVSEISQTELASHYQYTLGDKIGRGGIEESYENRLRGVDGKELIEVDAVGKKLRTVSLLAPIPGENLYLSIDASLQQEAFAQIDKKKAAVVATDPATGAVLILTSSPSFDPNIFTDFSLEPVLRSRLIQEVFMDKSQPLFDRTISGTYPPGSTFKIVTATAGLETGKITESTTVDDPGVLVIGPYKFPNWKYLRDGGLQGVLNVVGALQKSNDIFFYKAGEATGIDGLADWAKRFGLSKPLGIDLPGEAGGMIRSDREWFLGDTYHTAIGQGDLLVTPLQINGWTSVIANGGRLCVPQVLAGKTGITGITCKDLGISKKTIGLIREGLVAACSPGGTAWPLFAFKVQIACKTGTAEFGDPQNKTHAWLTAFAPTDKPTIAVTVLVEGGGEGSDVAAPIVKKILEKRFAD